MLLDTFRQGGWLMWPLAACSVALFALLMLHFPAALWRRLRRKSALPAAPLGKGETPDPAAPKTYAQRLKFFFDIPPQLGLLGTVLGLVQMFQDELSRDAFSAGVAVACFTTIFGIALAIVARTAAYALDALSPTPAA